MCFKLRSAALAAPPVTKLMEAPPRTNFRVWGLAPEFASRCMWRTMSRSRGRRPRLNPQFGGITALVRLACLVGLRAWDQGWVLP
jgi:hypothetical protein